MRLIAQLLEAELPDDAALLSEAPSRLADLLPAITRLQLKGSLRQCRADRLARQPLPAIAQDRQGRFFIIAQVRDGQCLVHDPLTSISQRLDAEQLAASWTGQLLRIEAPGNGGPSRFDFTWFIPVLVKYRKPLGQTLLVSLFLQLFALVTPLFFQVVMDKVLIHRAFTTLDVLAAALLLLLAFESLLSGLRNYFFAHTACRIDVELGAQLFKHLIELPLSYFAARRVGDSVARVRELENIRGFLTDNSVILLLDVLFSVVFVALMWRYSPWLTAVVLASVPVYLLVSLVMTPILRARLDISVGRQAQQQAFLVETLRGIDTVKALALEPQTIRQWDQHLAASAAAGFRTQNSSVLTAEAIGFISKLLAVITLYVGARLVIDGQMTAGQFIAFNMLSGRVTQPLQRLAQLWVSFQQTGLAMQRLADILDTRPERAAAAQPGTPALNGQVRFDNVHFTYPNASAAVLQGLDLHIRPGEVVGIVGPSGSGKSTLAKLLQRLYVPQAGRVLFDEQDVSQLNLQSLREQIGVVEQESLLFNLSIRANIALADPGSPLDDVIAAAKTAGAHAFILEQAQGYDTLVDEHGASLSGGQRQRLAIARALLRDPRLLIFDEATSALDYESERVIQQNMQAISADRTMIIIAHRLQAVRHADRIVVLDKGRVVEEGCHDLLVGVEEGYYRGLWESQVGAGE